MFLKYSNFLLYNMNSWINEIDISIKQSNKFLF